MSDKQGHSTDAQQVGRYQLFMGVVHHRSKQRPTVFRIDTVTGSVQVFDLADGRRWHQTDDPHSAFRLHDD